MFLKYSNSPVVRPMGTADYWSCMFDNETALSSCFLTPWLLICGDQSRCGLRQRGVQMQAKSRVRLSACAWQQWWGCWWKPNALWPLRLIKHTHAGFVVVFRTLNCSEQGRKGTRLPLPISQPACFYLFMDCTTSGKIIPLPERCHSIFHVARHQSAVWEEMVRTTSWT